jgi:plastocyanin
MPRRPTCVAAASLAATLLFAAAHLQAATVEVEVRDASGKPLRDAVVFLESPDARRLAKPLPKAELGQENRQFVPRVLTVTRGTEVNFPNRDTVRHHVYSFSPAKKFELKLYTGTPPSPVPFDTAGVVVLGCNIHDHMVAWVVVVDTPYFAQTRDGRARIEGVPAGTYQLRTWHPGLPVGAQPLEQRLPVAATGVSSATVRMPGLPQ